MHPIPDPTQLLPYALAFIRIGGLLFALPIIGDPPTPVRVRVLLAMALTIALIPVIPANWAPNLATDVITTALYIGRELLIGLSIGFVARLAFDGILMAASMVAYQMGFGTGGLFLPDFGGQMDSFTALHRMLVMLIFVSLNLHHMFIDAIAASFRLLAGGSPILTGGLASTIVGASATLLSVSVQLAAPILVALLFTMAALGLASRAVPQLNVFQLSFPVSFFIGLMVYIATLPFYPGWMQEHFLNTHEQFSSVMRALSG